MSDATQEIEQGERFAFGANWARFLRTLDDARIAKAEEQMPTGTADSACRNSSPARAMAATSSCS